MAFCRTCGKHIRDEAVICPLCGVPTEVQKIKSPTGVIVAGYICAFLALFFPLPLGLPAVLIGATNIFKGSTGHGIAQISIAVLLGIIGFIIGMAAFARMSGS